MEMPGAVSAAIRAAAPDVVINAAAFTAVDQAEDEPDRAFRVNGAAAGEIAHQCRVDGARLIHLSTDYVFDGTAPDPYGPDAPTNPLGIYGRSKLEGENRIREEAPHHVIVRTAWVYSPFGRNFVKTMMELAHKHEEVRVVSDQVGNPSSARDLADGIIAILRQWAAGIPAAGGETYHLAGSGEASWWTLASHIFEECLRLGLPAAKAVPITTAQWPTRARRPANSRLDCAKFARDFGFVMPDWRGAVADTVDRLGSKPNSDGSRGAGA